MKNIEKDELYENLNQFLKGKGIELKEGQYTKGIHAGCSLLADAINLSQAGFERARTEVERQLDQIRQVIHEKTAPKGTSASAKTSRPDTESGKSRQSGAASSARKATGRKGKAPRNRRTRK